MKRLSTKVIPDYQNPIKLSSFSPSPIKRYQYVANTHNDNKENNAPYHRNIFSDRQKQPHSQQYKTQSQPQKPRNVRNQYEGVIALKTSILANIDRAEYQMQQKLQNYDSKNMVANNSNKRFQKLHSKEQAKASKTEQINQLINQQATQSKVPMQNVEISRIKDSDIINQNLNKQSDSPMDATYQSTNSILNGVQFQGRWTAEEHQKFVEGLKLFGKDWKKIEDYIGSRTCAQIRSHAQKYFNRLQRERSKYKASEIQHKKTLDVNNHKANIAPKSSAIQSSTNRQLKQISETFSKLAEDDLLINLKQLLAEREYISQQLMDKSITAQQACEQLIILTNQLHQLSLKALANSKIDLYQRLVDERNLSQLICILLSQQVVVMPDQIQKKESPDQTQSQLPSFLLKDCSMLGGLELQVTAKSSPRNDHSTAEMHDHSPHTYMDVQ